MTPSEYIRYEFLRYYPEAGVQVTEEGVTYEVMVDMPDGVSHYYTGKLTSDRYVFHRPTSGTQPITVPKIRDYELPRKGDPELRNAIILDGYVELEVVVHGKIRCYDFHLDQVGYYITHLDDPDRADHYAAGTDPILKGE